MRSFWAKIYTFFIGVYSSIAFIPSVISLVAFGLGVLLVSIDDIDILNLLSRWPVVEIQTIETLRAILTTFLTAVVSILIFSFSMVMVVLNQAAAQYSPRILDWLITKKSNQYILGVFLGTIIFTLLLLLQLPKDTDFKPAYHLAIFIDAILIFFCLVLFVRLISNVSGDIKISQIVKNIHSKTLQRIEEEETNISKAQLDRLNGAKWIRHDASEGGYLQNIAQEYLLRVAKKHDLKIRVNLRTGYYYIKGDPLIYIDKEIEDEKLRNDIASAFVFYTGEKIQDNSFYGFKQLAEVAIKALSPGINDPHTATSCVDYLTELFIERIRKQEARLIKDKDGNERIFIYPYSFEDLVDISLVPILKYGSEDPQVIASLMELLEKVGNKDKGKMHQQKLNLFLKAVLSEAGQHTNNDYFNNYLEKYKDRLRQVEDNYYYVLVQEPNAPSPSREPGKERPGASL